MNKKPTRRKFVKTVAAAVSLPHVVPASVLAGSGTVPPSDRIVMAAIGSGGKGQHNTNAFMRDSSVQLVAVCDVDQNHLKTGVDAVNQHYGNQDCLAYTDLREIICRDDIDAVHVSTPDHWHAAASVRALDSGKDVYCEKPLANSFGESKAIREAAKRSGRILQCGSHERSNNNCRFAAELVRNGRLGEIHTVRINMPCEQEHHLQARGTKVRTEGEAIPEHLDWDLWLGPVPPTPYWSGGGHFWWRFILNHGGGEMTDRGAHIIDIAQLALGMDHSGPVEYAARGVQIEGSPYDAFWDYEFTNTYANGVKMIGSTQGPRGLRFEGTDGWLFVAIHGGAMTASRPELLPENVRQGKPVQVDQMIPDFETQLGRSPGHHRNFIESVKTRQAPMATAEIGHRTATICHLNNIAMRVGRPIRWDPETEALINDNEAARWLVPEMRSRWAV
ncbi:MAG: Gfo/Idh/MocA family oxidoreductase [Mariniblastus sp.]|nr:Gfo/Idh/MocA family oxidoreductase [Mariniblastus sp.]